MSELFCPYCESTPKLAEGDEPDYGDLMVCGSCSGISRVGRVRLIALRPEDVKALSEDARKQVEQAQEELRMWKLRRKWKGQPS